MSGEFMTTSASIVIYGKAPTGWRRGKPVIGKNGKLKPRVMTLKGVETPVENSHFEFQYYTNGKVQNKNVGTDYAVAQTVLAKYTKVATATDILTDLGVILPGLVGGSKTIAEYRKSFLFERARGSKANIRL